MIEERVKELLNQQNKKVKDLCEFIGITDAGLRKIYARDSCEISTLKKISSFFNVSPCYFLEQSKGVAAMNDSIAVGGNAQNVNSYGAIQELVTEISKQRLLSFKGLFASVIASFTFGLFGKKQTGYNAEEPTNLHVT